MGNKFCISLIMLLMVSYCSGVTAIASTNNSGVSFTIYEYDRLLESRELKRMKFSLAGYSDHLIARTIGNTEERVLLEYSRLPEDELQQKFGYTLEQIAVLKDYDGSSLEDAPELRRVLGQMSGNIRSGTCSNKAITAKFSWDWTTAPAFYAYEDVIGVRWKGTAPDHSQMDLQMDSRNTTAMVSYYDVADKTLAFAESIPFLVNDPQSHAEIPLQRLSGSLLEYAKKGTVGIRIEAEGTGIISKATFDFGYGMTTSQNSYSIGFPASFSITFGTGTDRAFYKAVVISSTGQVTNY